MQPFFDSLNEHLGEVSATLAGLSTACRENPELRAELDADPRAFLAARGGGGLNLPADADLRVVENTPEVFHLVMPQDPNATVSDETLAGVAGGTNWGGTSDNYGCASSAGTIPSTISSASTASSETVRWASS